MHQKGPSGNEYPPDGSIVAMKSGTSTKQGQTGQTSETGAVPPGSCSCDKTKHLVWDGYEGCNCICEKGFKFNEAGDCVPDLPETDGSEIEEALALELETLEGTKTIKPNEKVPVTLSHATTASAHGFFLSTGPGQLRTNFTPGHSRRLPWPGCLR